MKTIEAIYKFGNLYDKKTKKRILIEDSTQLAIVIPPDKLLEQDPNLVPSDLKNSEDKRKEINLYSKKHKSVRYWKLFDAGQKLLFSISAGVKKRKKTESIQCVFHIRLLEDLYIRNKNKLPKYARFFDCHCLVESCSNNFEFFEPIHAKSLNDAYTKTYELYFAMFAKSTANTFKRIYENKPEEPIGVKAESIQKRPANNDKKEKKSSSIFVPVKLR